MKIMAASDIHGSAYYCERMLRAFERERADRLLLLGDLLYHGPRNDLPKEYSPKRAAEMLNSFSDRIFSVRGNCDAEVDGLMLEFPIMAEYCVLMLGERIVYASHGHHFGEENPPPLRTGDILLCGHTHIPKCTEHEGYLYANTGSVSLPKLQTEHSYMILTEEKLVWKNLDGECFDSYRL